MINLTRFQSGQHCTLGRLEMPSGWSCFILELPWQHTSHYHDRNEGKDSANDHGQWRGSQFRTSLVGGTWASGAEAGARCVALNSNPWDMSDPVGLRAVCDSL